ncbi:MAG: hypothetical protein QNJ81_11070 [Acidimicrobiia bacterium]|nr:hypothetical protein [Acidimicrobiia bacterium]
MDARFGPRITHFSLPAAENVFADLGDMGIDLPDGRRYTLRGGHRLWAAPEIPEITYEPDDDHVTITAAADRLIASGPPTSLIGKSISAQLTGNRVEVNHTLTNQSGKPIDVAPWAITQLVPGGTAIVPLAEPPADPHGLQPNASVVVWPYTGVDDSPFVMRNRLLLLDGDRDTATKVGVALTRGWLAYVREGMVFVKRAKALPGGNYLDRGASGQCYSGADFLELETLGEQVLLGPGDSVTHVETWELHVVASDTPAHQIPAVLDLDGGRTT